MSRLVLILVLACTAAGSTHLNPLKVDISTMSMRPKLSDQPAKLILDTDMGGGGCADVDDVAALCMVNALVDNGEVDLLAVMANTSPEPVAGVISVLNHYYGRDEVPIGAYKGNGLNSDARYLSYVTDLVNDFASPIKNASQAFDSVDLYREILAAQDDHSVIISSIGLLTNIADLLRSPADEAIGSLSGIELVARKVKYLAVMGGMYPEGEECNFSGGFGVDDASLETSRKATAYVVENMPPNVPVVYSGFEIGFQVQSGGSLSSCAPETSPCRRAFEDYEGGPNLSRYSWDPLSTLAALRGWGAASCEGCTDCNGINSVDSSTGANSWVSGSATNQTYLVLVNADTAGNAVDDLLCQTPLGS